MSREKDTFENGEDTKSLFNLFGLCFTFECCGKTKGKTKSTVLQVLFWNPTKPRATRDVGDTIGRSR